MANVQGTLASVLIPNVDVKSRQEYGPGCRGINCENLINSGCSFGVEQRVNELVTDNEVDGEDQ